MNGRTNITDRMCLVAAIQFKNGNPIDTVLDHVVTSLKAEGHRIGGFIQREMPDSVSCCSVTHLEGIIDGRLTRITQALGRGSKGCRLDPEALAKLSGLLLPLLDSGIDLLVLNRFGKAESEGQGFRGVIEKCFQIGIPVLTAVRDTYSSAWSAFGGEFVETLAPCPDSTLGWCRAVLGREKAMTYSP